MRGRARRRRGEMATRLGCGPGASSPQTMSKSCELLNGLDPRLGKHDGAFPPEWFRHSLLTSLAVFGAKHHLSGDARMLPLSITPHSTKCEQKAKEGSPPEIFITGAACPLLVLFLSSSCSLFSVLCSQDNVGTQKGDLFISTTGRTPSSSGAATVRIMTRSA